jgi:dTDP-4-dehydrorhamnose 3,5-epimerase
MIFSPTKLAGAYVVALDPHSDERGCFARTWCAEEFAQQGLDARLTQCNLSYSKRRGTIRGLHLQAPPHEEAKLVRVTRGAVYDVAVDLRADSPTFGQWLAVELTMENRLALFVPIGCAHGLQTLADDTEVLYQMTTPYVPSAARGVRWDDPTIDIAWPELVSEISNHDRHCPTLDTFLSSGESRQYRLQRPHDPVSSALKCE